MRSLTTRFRSLLSSEDGFGLLELLIAMTMFAIVSAPLAGVLLASISEQSLAKQRTLASETAQSAIESIRALPYSSVGLQNGNPTGTIAPTQTASAFGVAGLDATVTTRISYMDDAPATAYRTRADYKRVIVTVTRNADGRRLTQTATYVAPPGGGTFAGQNEGVVLAQVIDFPLNLPVIGASVQLTGPGPVRNDTTDGAGNIVFPSLQPTTGTQTYALTVAAQGYSTLKDDLPPSTTAQSAVVGGQTFQTVLRVYKASTITLNARTATGVPYTGTVTATVSSSRGSESFTFSGGTRTIQTIAGEGIVPSLQYTARLLAADGTYSAPLTQLVPTSYPTDNTKTFTMTLGGSPVPMVTLTVRAVTAGGARIPGATVTLTGGPGSSVALTGTTDSSGNAAFSIPSNSSPGYAATVTNGTLTGSLAATGVTTSTTKNVTLR
jgi:prepilin-type N-terminal cleavage/methylation domain-containing protein